MRPNDVGTIAGYVQKRNDGKRFNVRGSYPKFQFNEKLESLLRREIPAPAYVQHERPSDGAHGNTANVTTARAGSVAERGQALAIDVLERAQPTRSL